MSHVSACCHCCHVVLAWCMLVAVSPPPPPTHTHTTTTTTHAHPNHNHTKWSCVFALTQTSLCRLVPSRPRRVLMPTVSCRRRHATHHHLTSSLTLDVWLCCGWVCRQRKSVCVGGGVMYVGDVAEFGWGGSLDGMGREARARGPRGAGVPDCQVSCRRRHATHHHLTSNLTLDVWRCCG
jgi:hypothetical protein